MQDTQETLVVFRVWKSEPKRVIALFPEEPADCCGRHCSNYMHVGQHSGADYAGCIRRTRPAKINEEWELRMELDRIGYRLNTIDHARRGHAQRRHEKCKVQSQD